MLETTIFYILFSAPGFTDNDLENKALQISRPLPSIEVCELRKSITSFYNPSRYYWCEQIEVKS